VTTVSLVDSVRKRLPSRALAFWALALLSLAAACTMGGEDQVYNARLSPFPEIGGTPAGMGAATATLHGTTLQVTGSYEGLTHQAGRGSGPMPVAASAASLKAGQLTGVAGEHLFDLTLGPAGDGSSGTISGEVELSSDQIEMLRAGRIYAQIDSEPAPDGHLWGWFLQEED
jgi:CHRD domain